jgi:hypothetical protein
VLPDEDEPVTTFLANPFDETVVASHSAVRENKLALEEAECLPLTLSLASW